MVIDRTHALPHSHTVVLSRTLCWEKPVAVLRARELYPKNDIPGTYYQVKCEAESSRVFPRQVLFPAISMNTSTILGIRIV